MDKKRIFKYEIIIPLIILCLLTISVLFIYSANINSSGILISKEHIKQIAWSVMGLTVMIGLSLFDVEKFKELAIYFYIFTLILILLTFFTNPINGARSWLNFGFMSLQPSEFCKIATIFLLAYFIEKADDMENLKNFLICLGIAVLPGLLILLQPDLGSAVVFFSIFIFMLFIGGTKLRYIIYTLSTFVLTIILTTVPFIDEKMNDKKSFIYEMTYNEWVYNFTFFILILIFTLSLIGTIIFKKQYFYWTMYIFFILISSFAASFILRHVLKEYQIMRLVIFVNPYYDPLDSGWNIIQSLTAVGSGGLTGKGYLQGTQSHYQFLPKQSSDFIFSVISEEAGFMGSITVILLYFGLILRLLYISYKSSSKFGSVFCAGFVGMIFFHFFINVGMTMSLTPITGIPLLFVSYGGSSLLSCSIATGICMSINNRRR